MKKYGILILNPEHYKVYKNRTEFVHSTERNEVCLLRFIIELVNNEPNIQYTLCDPTFKFDKIRVSCPLDLHLIWTVFQQTVDSGPGR